MVSVTTPETFQPVAAPLTRNIRKKEGMEWWSMVPLMSCAVAAPQSLLTVQYPCFDRMRSSQSLLQLWIADDECESHHLLVQETAWVNDSYEV
jgi:hypothetical protein